MVVFQNMNQQLKKGKADKSLEKLKRKS